MIYEAMAFEQIIINTIKHLTSTIYKQATQAVIIVESSTIRYRVDGGIPTTSIGMLANVGDIITLSSSSDIANFQAIAIGVNALLSITYSA